MSEGHRALGAASEFDRRTPDCPLIESTRNGFDRGRHLESIDILFNNLFRLSF